MSNDSPPVLPRSATAPLPPLPDLGSLASASDRLRESHGFTDAAHWVVPGLLMQGARPTEDADEIRAIFVEAGCRTFACLQAECVPEEGAAIVGDGGVRDWMDDPMDLPRYGDAVRAAAVARREGAGGGLPPSFLHYGIRDMCAAESVEGLHDVVSELAGRIGSGEVIYLHCWGGKGRAGLVAACLLAKLYRLDADSALEYARALVQLRNVDGRKTAVFASPETKEQRDQVQEYCRWKSGRQEL